MRKRRKSEKMLSQRKFCFLSLSFSFFLSLFFLALFPFSSLSLFRSPSLFLFYVSFFLSLAVTGHSLKAAYLYMGLSRPPIEIAAKTVFFSDLKNKMFLLFFSLSTALVTWLISNFGKAKQGEKRDFLLQLNLYLSRKGFSLSFFSLSFSLSLFLSFFLSLSLFLSLFLSLSPFLLSVEMDTLLFYT